MEEEEEDQRRREEESGMSGDKIRAAESVVVPVMGRGAKPETANSCCLLLPSASTVSCLPLVWPVPCSACSAVLAAGYSYFSYLPPADD